MHLNFRSCFITALASSALCAMALPGIADDLDVPVVEDCVSDGQAACYATSQVKGLNPNGDGFLAVRTGPGSEYRMIDKLFNNDIVFVIEVRGAWRGVGYRDGRKGWVHSNWLEDLAG